MFKLSVALNDAFMTSLYLISDNDLFSVTLTVGFVKSIVKLTVEFDELLAPSKRLTFKI